MQLSDRFRHLFASPARSRGAKIVRKVVLDAFGDGPPFSAVAHGSMPYEVCIDPGDRREAGSCECPAFVQNGPCKHMWATMLALDEARMRGMTAGGSGWTGDVARRPATRAPEKLKTQPKRKPQPFAVGVKRLEQMLRDGVRPLASPVDHVARRVRRVEYHLMSPRRVLANGECVVLAATRSRMGNGEWSVPKSLDEVGFPEWRPSDEDRALLDRLDPFDVYRSIDEFQEFVLPSDQAFALVRELARTARLFWCDQLSIRGTNAADCPDVVHDDGESLTIDCAVSEIGGEGVALAPRATRGGRAVTLEDGPVLIGPEHLLVGQQIVHWESDAPRELVMDLLTRGPVEVPAQRVGDLQTLLTPAPTLEVAEAPICQLRLQYAIDAAKHGRLVRGRLTFLYGSESVEAAEDVGTIEIDEVPWLRNLEAENAHLERFEELGGILHWELNRPTASLAVPDLVPRIEGLLAAGFEVYAADDRVRQVSGPSFSVKTGIDWFDVEARVEIDGASTSLPDLLKLIAGKKGFVRLGVGEVGLLGDRDLRGLAHLAEVGKVDGDTIRFAKNQGFLLDAMLQEREGEEVRMDKKFAVLRARSRQGVELESAVEPKGFGATLRPYQREGLGWFRFLQDLGVGGCLADDMGLGKTVQVLALLEQQRRRRPHPGPSLVVAPKTLVFHWEREARRFAPNLGVLSFIGTGRFDAFAPAVADGFSGFDMVITTYGSLRNDVPKFADIEWNFVILDEAQAIKNPRSQASKAVRLCRSRQRLALSGTPIENHLGELWALFEFLNPGMLGAAKVFRNLVAEGSVAGAPSFRDTLRAAVRPFMLRRTKEQVLTELPEKIVQTIDCELPPGQRKTYDALAAHYRASVLGELDTEKLPDEMRFMVLEALLRLRQVSCHPGLLDEKRQEEGCAKLDVLLPMLEELRSEGHKALVFSQFPTFLRLLRDRLEELDFEYAYIDGKTGKRELQVDRFQNDPDCGLFLISLKAGGHGLNLTAASYVFLLDPWWNPAVEAQAIDRAHRMGQMRRVHAYRLICRDTVERRVADLQDTKRALADAVLGDGDSFLQGLTGADVAALLE